MHAVNMIARAVGASAPVLPCAPISAICAVTGQQGPCLPRRDVIGESFTNIDCLKAPESSFVSVDVFTAWNYGYKTSEYKKRLKCPERMACWICDGKEFRELIRKEIRDLVLNGVPYTQWAAYVTTSYKKHGSLWTRINTGTRGVWRFEMLDADCRDGMKVLVYWNKMNEARSVGIGRQTIETLHIAPFVLEKVGIRAWTVFERWARPIHQSGLYQFITYLLPSKEELNGCV